ncbi:MAG: PAS domain S-box protein [Cellvibrionaceae bacterium]
MTFFALTPALVIGVFSHYQTKKSLEHEVLNRLNQTADMAAELVVNWFETRQLDIESLAATRLSVPVTEKLNQLLSRDKLPLLDALQSPAAQAISEPARRLLTGFQQRYRYIEDIHIVSMSGDIILTTKQDREWGKNINDDALKNTRYTKTVLEVVAKGQTQFSDIEHWPYQNDKRYGFFVTPILDSKHQVIGAFSMRVDLSPLMEALTGAINDNNHNYIIGEDGELRTPSNDSNHHKDIIATQAFSRWQQSPLDDHQSPRSTTYTDHSGDKMIAFVKHINILGAHWAYVSEVEASSALSAIDRVSNLIALTLILTAIASIALIQYLSGRIIRPLDDLSTMVSDIAEGKEVEHVEIESNDEIGRLSSTFNSMLIARKTYERQLEESNLFNQQILSAATEFAIIATDIQGTITHFNSGAERLLGYKSEELLYKNSPKVFHDRQQLEKRSKELSKQFSKDIDEFQSLVIMSEKHGSETREWIMIKADGTAIEVRLTVTTIRDNNQNIRGYLGMAQDITSSKQTEQLLTRLSRIVQETNNGVVITDTQGRVEWINQGFTTITGYTLEESIGKKPGAFLQGPDTDARTIESIKKSLREEQEFTEEILNYHKDGSAYWLEITCNPLYSRKGELEGFMAIETDITERKRRQEEHQDTLRYNKALADLTTDRSIMSGSLLSTQERITEQIAKAINSARASIWMFDDSAQHLKCIDQFDNNTQHHKSGIKILRKDYPYYFAAVLRHSIIAADDALSHSATTEFVDTYLKSNGITSVLNAIISGSEGIIGVVSIEHIGPQKSWSSAEISFASAMSTVIGGICEADQRREIQKQLITAKESKRSINHILA